MRKKSNLMILGMILISTIGMFASNFMLKSEYLKIDLSDIYKNYISVDKKAYSVLSISGSNGYPIDIIQKPHNNIRVLRSRQGHFNSNLIGDTMFIEFTGANISQQQAFLSETPSGIIIESNELTHVISDNTTNRIIGFSHQNFTLSLRGNSLSKISDCTVKRFEIDSKNNSQFEFSNNNQVDSLKIDLSGNSIAYLKEISFTDIHHSLTDSVTLVLSKSVTNRILQ